MTRILVVDDDPKIVELVKVYLERERYQVLVAHDGNTALELTHQRRPDLIILDLMLPQVGGLDVCRTLAAESDTPIIMLTARRTEDDKLLGLELGADDYITKPFSPRELVARVRVILRRAMRQKGRPTQVQLGNLLIDFTRYEVWRDGTLIPLTPREFDLLAALAEQPGRVFTRLELLEQVFGFDYEGLERTVDTHVMNLRKKIEPDATRPLYVQTVHGRGYRLMVAG